jgi:hypothetical protein
MLANNNKKVGIKVGDFHKKVWKVELSTKLFYANKYRPVSTFIYSIPVSQLYNKIIWR